MCQGRRRAGMCWQQVEAGDEDCHRDTLQLLHQSLKAAVSHTARGHHSQKLHGRGSGSPSPTTQGKCLLLSSRFLPAPSVRSGLIHHDRPARSLKYAAFGDAMRVAAFCSDGGGGSVSPRPRQPHGSHRAASSFPAGHQLHSPA